MFQKCDHGILIKSMVQNMMYRIPWIVRILGETQIVLFKNAHYLRTFHTWKNKLLYIEQNLDKTKYTHRM